MTRKERMQKAVRRQVVLVALGSAILSGCGGGGIEIHGPAFSGSWGGFVGSDVVETRTVSRDLTVTDQDMFRLDAINGDVSVVGDAAARSVTVHAEMQAGSHSAEDARKGLDAMDVLVSESGGEISVRTVHPAILGGREYAVIYTIILPADMEVAVTQSNGGVVVEDTESPVRVDVTNGDVHVSSRSGNAEVKVVNGGIRADTPLLPGETVLLSTGNGNIDLGIPSSTSAAFSAAAANGMIGVSNLELGNEVRTGKSVTGILGDGDGRIDLRVDFNGSIFVSGKS